MLEPMRRAARLPLIAFLVGAGIGTPQGFLPSQGVPSRAEGPSRDPDPLVASLQEKMERLTSLRGRFVQRLESRGLGRARIESGRFAIRKPGSMRWEYEKPEKKLAITDGRTTWLHLPEDNEVHVGRYPEDGGAAASSLLAGRLRLDEDFATRRMTPDESGPMGAAGVVAIHLTPRASREEFDALVMAVDPKSLTVRRLTVIDAIGGRMTFEFFDLEENAVLDDALFAFEMPRGAEVVDTR